ncbi:hypothetical protein NT05HA_2221 [Aggregatibacter aphrophilus NJ8700]|nr:hypothetical protein NT05HA_2221 [Aggregatibacter aphrophilus NJ8700]
MLRRQAVFNLGKECKGKGWIEFSESAVGEWEKNYAFNRRG